MYRDRVTNIHVTDVRVIATPAQVKAAYPLSDQDVDRILTQRAEVAAIVNRRDPRLLVVCGPCSIHDPAAALDYAQRLARLRTELQDRLYLVMRVYFEKPRTTIGWKGLINDPDLDDSCDVEKGLRLARELAVTIARMGVPMGTEALDPITPQYLADAFCWAAVGARTAESQTHREMASGLSMPVGFKNGTAGGCDMPVNACKAARAPHRFLGIDQDGRVALVSTQGNPDVHVILRGTTAPNYDSVSVAEYVDAMEAAGLTPSVVVDCSHGNSRKDYRRQAMVAMDVAHQVRDGNRAIAGLMLESNLVAGAQPLVDKASLQYGVSITDGCIGWEETESVLRRVHALLDGVV